MHYTPRRRGEQKHLGALSEGYFGCFCMQVWPRDTCFIYDDSGQVRHTLEHYRKQHNGFILGSEQQNVPATHVCVQIFLRINGQPVCSCVIVKLDSELQS